MNVYFLVEGKKTEYKVYPAWLSLLVPSLIKVRLTHEVNKHNYCLFSAEGYPSIIYDHIPNAVKDVNNHGSYDYLVVCLDADEETVESRIEEVNNFLKQEKIRLKNTKLVIIIQNRCIETWFLGNRRLIRNNPESLELRKYLDFYNLIDLDPELMGVYPGYSTHAHFHEAYLKEIFSERNIHYTKRNPGHVLESSYLEQLILHTQKEPRHLMTFQTFFNFCNDLKKLLD